MTGWKVSLLSIPPNRGLQLENSGLKFGKSFSANFYTFPSQGVTQPKRSNCEFIPQKSRIRMSVYVREDPNGLTPPPFGHCPFGGGGGLNTCPDGLGHLFREELSKFKWAYPCFWGGLKACPDDLGHLPFSEAYNPPEW